MLIPKMHSKFGISQAKMSKCHYVKKSKCKYSDFQSFPIYGVNFVVKLLKTLPYNKLIFLIHCALYQQHLPNVKKCQNVKKIVLPFFCSLVQPILIQKLFKNLFCKQLILFMLFAFCHQCPANVRKC